MATDGTVYVGERTARRTGRAAAYDASSGERLWTFSRSKSYDGDASPKPAVPVSSPVVVEGAAFVVIEDTVYALGE